MSSRGRTEERPISTKWTGTASRYRTFSGNELDTIITGHLTQEQLDAYQQFFRIEEISDVLRTASKSKKGVLSILPSGNEVVNPNFQRDVSPPPKYDNFGNRTNTRDERTKILLETERDYLVEVATKSIPNFIAPFDYNKPIKNSEKLYVPTKDYPDINFMGLLLGPRGNTLKMLREESGAVLQIRGKGSVKDGKALTNDSAESDNSSTAFSNPNLSSNSDELHVLITADNHRKIAKAIELTNKVIEKAISSPMGQNDLKRGQLRELAILNGTFRETKAYVPMNDRPQRPQMDITSIVCKICGKVGHFSRDCKMNQTNSNFTPLATNGAHLPKIPNIYQDQDSHQKRPIHNDDEFPKRQKSNYPLPSWQTSATITQTAPIPVPSTLPPPSVVHGTMPPSHTHTAPPPPIHIIPPPPTHTAPPPQHSLPPPPPTSIKYRAVPPPPPPSTKVQPPPPPPPTKTKPPPPPSSH